MTVRYLVDDVDAALPFYRALGFRLADRWGPPFAVMKGQGLTLWLAGPGTSARKKLASGALPAPGGWNRIVVETKDLDATLAKAVAAGGKPRGKPIKGPGGRQVLAMILLGLPAHRRDRLLSWWCALPQWLQRLGGAVTVVLATLLAIHAIRGG